MVNKFLIKGFRWFERTNGNSYHTIRITNLNKNEVIHTSKFIIYGYGDQYRQTAYEVLLDLKLVKEEDRHNHEMNKKRFIWIVNDFPRKKDILNI